ncbi:MAG: sigma-70 family RNA polymerase sigma factor [Verrucomicrobia bacterium]|nr:sigma-70 family RNA polymerase sigma factor [Verrucomicrobiota bacterium]
MDENALIQRVQSGDIEAYGELMGSHIRRVRSFIALSLPVPHRIDEIAHETFLFAFQNIREFQAGTSFSSWLIAIAANVVRTEVQRFKREKINQQKYTEHRLFEVLEAHQPEYVSREAEWLEKCLERIPANLRSLLDFKYRLSCSTNEIAASFRQSAAWVRTTLFRLRQQLRNCVRAQIKRHA